MAMMLAEAPAYRAVDSEYEVISPELGENYLLVDDIPQAYEARQVVRDAAQRLVETRRLSREDNSIEYEPVDALSTADSVLRSEHKHGAESDEYTEKWSGLLLDCQRLVGEWYRKKRPEYFEPVRHVFDAKKQEFFSHGLSIRQMTENALVPISDDPEEESRRINERVEEETPHILRSLGSLALGKGIVTISQCTDSAIESYRADVKAGNKHQGYRGYVPEIEKVMIRHIALDPYTNDRFETQIGLPGTYLNHETMQIALEEKGIDASRMDKTTLHGAQLLADEDPMDFIQHLDVVASQQWCRNIFMGEEVPKDYVKDYEAFKREALQRKEDLKGWAETVALFVLDLAREGFDRKKAPEQVENFVKNMLLNVAKKNQAVAEQMFDAKTAEGLKAVALLEAQGRHDEANEMMKHVERNAPGGGSCGGGSCGLEGVAERSSEDAALRKKLGASEGDIIVKDKERACRCGKKSVVYAYNKSKVIKMCQSCGAYEKSFKKA